MMRTLLFLCLGLHVTLGHICLLSPKQRGPLDVSTAGSHTCFRHAAPCGGQPIEQPSVVFTAGQTTFIRWQQNFNHYDAGYPGYMDLAIADSPNSTEFKTLAVVSDAYVFAQWHQQNFTALLKMPDMKCDHCVLRARYNSHKPGETPFLQCADIKIASPSDFESADLKLKYNSEKHLKQQTGRRLLPLKRAMLLRETLMKKFHKEGIQAISSPNLYGFAFNPFVPKQCQYVSVDTSSGQVTNVGAPFAFGLDSINMKWTSDPSMSGKYMVDEVVSVDYSSSLVNIVVHSNGSRDTWAGSMFLLGLNDAHPAGERSLTQLTTGAINALTWRSPGMHTAFLTQEAETPGSFYFEVGTVDDMCVYTPAARIDVPESLYVNFQWLEAAASNSQRVYALLGNENAPQALNARIYTFDVYEKKFLGFVELNVSQFTFMSIHSHPSSANLFAFSPGLWNDASHEWNLVAIDPTTGKVIKQCNIAPAGIFSRYYGGSVHTGNPKDSSPAMLYHVLRVEYSEADMIVGVNPMTCEMTFSEATNMRHVHSVVSGMV